MGTHLVLVCNILCNKKYLHNISYKIVLKGVRNLIYDFSVCVINNL